MLADIDFEEEEQFVELNLPFLQQILPNPFEIIPIYMGNIFSSPEDQNDDEPLLHKQSAGRKLKMHQNSEKVEEIMFCSSLEDHFNRDDSLFIFNVNLVRWGEEFCFTQTNDNFVQTFLSVEAILKEVTAVLEQQSLVKFQDYVENKRVSIEGREAIYTMLYLLEQCDSTTVTKAIKYTLSNFIEGKEGRCIAYTAVVSFIERTK